MISTRFSLGFPVQSIRRYSTLALFILVFPGGCDSGDPGSGAETMRGEDSYDLVILGGRVMDPETERDQVANVGISGDRIVIITEEPIQGSRTIDATGHMVAPGFIDILSSIRPEREAHEDKAADGVTTAIGLHGGPLDVEGYVERQQGARPVVNYAATVDHREVREAAGAADLYEPASPEQIPVMKDLARQALRDGAIGVGFGLNYSPGASYEETYAMFQVAADEGGIVALHARYKGNVFPLTMSLATMEVIAMAAASGAQAQLVHLISSTVGSAPLSIQLIEDARAHGVDLGFDFHVWTRNQTSLQSALYDEGWQERFGGADYSDVYVSQTQERLTEERFHELRAQPGALSVQADFIPEEEILMGIRSPLGIISSDGGGLVDGTGHPRSVGTFARFLRRYVREQQVVGWMEGIKRITLLPAQRLEKAMPAMRRKGRLQEGMDADITIFDPTTVRERATYAEPDRRSAGIPFVIVNGQVVVEAGSAVSHAAPGRWLGEGGRGSSNALRPQARDPDLEELARRMTGSFSSAEQALLDTTFADINLHMVPIWRESQDGVWLYVEQSEADAPEAPYRQRVYHLTAEEGNLLRSAVYSLPGDPLVHVGAWKETSPLESLDPADLVPRVGCDVLLRRNQDGDFVGGTLVEACPSSLHGATYATTEVEIFPDSFVSWDRGFNADGTQVWGSAAGGYVFRKIHR